MRALLDSKARPKRATKPVIWPVLGRQSRQIVRAHCVKLGIPPCGGVPAIEHKEDAGACHLDFTFPPEGIGSPTTPNLHYIVNFYIQLIKIF